MPARKKRAVAFIFLPKFFRKRSNGFGAVSRLFAGAKKPEKLKNFLFLKKSLTAKPAAIPHKKQEARRIMNIGIPRAAV
jgi:hypothetical protein